MDSNLLQPANIPRLATPTALAFSLALTRSFFLSSRRMKHAIGFHLDFTQDRPILTLDFAQASQAPTRKLWISIIKLYQLMCASAKSTYRHDIPMDRVGGRECSQQLILRVFFESFRLVTLETPTNFLAFHRRSRVVAWRMTSCRRDANCEDKSADAEHFPLSGVLV
ncbi:hypothetical protein DFH09DRAFT_1138375 [Mycena vulgaris]|nr:hypothetical protein DFH09DRAFT_1138375 [Mycena vulgaris]